MFPFTSAQWQELEHQALIYKYMASGIPIPPDLIFPIKRTCLDSSTFSSKLFPCQPSHLGWSCFQMGLGRKIDPEPGRCRRTDGKKWRCSKEAYPDSKYCERHMHRGKNRSRKPVELGPTTTSLQPTNNGGNNNTNSSSPSTVTRNNNPLTPSLLLPPPSSHSLSLLPPNYQFLSSPNTSRTLGFESLDSSSLSNIDYSQRAYGLKEEVNEHAFLSEPSGSIGNLSSPNVDDTWQLTPLTMSSSCSSSNSSSSKQRGLNEYSYLQLQSLSDHNKQFSHQQHHHHHQGYGLMERADKEAEPQKTVHRFFDEWPPKNNKDSWLDLDDKSSSASVSTTKLSISIPSSSHEFPIFSSRSHYDG